MHPTSLRPTVDLSPSRAGAGGGPAQKAGNKGTSGACAEVTCCLRGRLRRPREGIGRKWCRASLENQFVPPLIGHFAPPLWELLGRCASRSWNRDPDGGGAALACLRTLKILVLSSASYHFPFLFPWGSPASLCSGLFHKEAGSGTFPHSLTWRFFSPVTWLHFAPTPCLPISFGRAPFHS